MTRLSTLCVLGGSESFRFNKSERRLSLGGGAGAGRGDKGPIEGHARSCGPAQVKVMEGARRSSVLEAEAGTPAEREEKVTVCSCSSPKLKPAEDHAGTQKEHKKEPMLC